MNKKALDEMTFEEALAALDEAVNRLEAGDLPLEAMLGVYQHGQELAAFCRMKLETAELKLQQIDDDLALSE